MLPQVSLSKTRFKILVNENDKTAILSSFHHNHKNTRIWAEIPCKMRIQTPKYKFLLFSAKIEKEIDGQNGQI